jgi:hypothetical protein
VPLELYYVQYEKFYKQRLSVTILTARFHRFVELQNNNNNNNYYYFTVYTHQIKPRRRWAGHVARMGEYKWWGNLKKKTTWKN